MKNTSTLPPSWLPSLTAKLAVSKPSSVGNVPSWRPTKTTATRVEKNNEFHLTPFGAIGRGRGCSHTPNQKIRRHVLAPHTRRVCRIRLSVTAGDARSVQVALGLPCAASRCRSITYVRSAPRLRPALLSSWRNTCVVLTTDAAMARSACWMALGFRLECAAMVSRETSVPRYRATPLRETTLNPGTRDSLSMSPSVKPAATCSSEPSGLRSSNTEPQCC